MYKVKSIFIAGDSGREGGQAATVARRDDDDEVSRRLGASYIYIYIYIYIF